MSERRKIATLLFAKNMQDKFEGVPQEGLEIREDKLMEKSVFVDTGNLVRLARAGTTSMFDLYKTMVDHLDQPKPNLILVAKPDEFMARSAIHCYTWARTLGQKKVKKSFQTSEIRPRDELRSLLPYSSSLGSAKMPSSGETASFASK